MRSFAFQRGRSTRNLIIRKRVRPFSPPARARLFLSIKFSANSFLRFLFLFFYFSVFLSFSLSIFFSLAFPTHLSSCYSFSRFLFYSLSSFYTYLIRLRACFSTINLLVCLHRSTTFRQQPLVARLPDSDFDR